MTDADGYFSPRDHPQEMVADPSLPQKVLEEEEAAALAAATAASLSGNFAGRPRDGGGSRRAVMGADEFVGSERDGERAAAGGGGIGGMGDSPPRYTFAPEEEEMVADGFRGGVRSGYGGMGGIGGMGGMGMGMGMGIGMGHVPMEMVMPETVTMQQAPQLSPIQQPQLQPPQLPEVPQPSIPLPVPSLPLMQPLQAPLSMSDRPPVAEESEESTCPDCDDLEGRCRCRRRGRRPRHRRRGSVGEGECGGHRGRSEPKHRLRRQIMCTVWGAVLVMVVWGAWTMYHGFTHRGPPGPSWVEWMKKEHHEYKFQCHHAPHSYIGQNIFRFPVDGGNASDAAPSFYLHQRPLNPSHQWRLRHGTRFAGEVVVAGYTPVQPEDEGMVKVEFDISMSRDGMEQAMKLEKGKDGNGVTIYTDYKAPKWEDWKHSEHPRGPPGHPACATVRVLVSIPRGINGETQNAATAVLRKLDIDVQSLCITIDHASLDLIVEENTTLQSFCGDITLAGTRDDGPPFDLDERSQFRWMLSGSPPEKLDMQTVSDASVGFRTKSLVAKTLTGRIHAVPMRRAPGAIAAENAELETTSGHIRVAAVPRLASSGHSGPPNITIRTVSGDVLLDRSPTMDATVPLDKFRSTSTYIQTITGRIVGETLLTNGSLLDVKSFSGDIDLFHVSVPDGTPSNPPFLKTETKSGSTRVKVLPVGAQSEYTPEGSDDDEIMSRRVGNQGTQGKFMVRGKHTSVSGHIDAVYYTTWEGGFVGRSLSGEVRPAGAGVLLVPFNDRSYEPEHWSEISPEDADIPNPDPTIWKIVRARKGQKGSGGMVEIESVTGDVDFLVGARRGWMELLRAAKEKGKEWLRKVGCVFGKEKKGQMVSVGVQTGDVIAEEEKIKEVKEGDERIDEVKQEEQKTAELKQPDKTLVETKAAKGKPSEIEPTAAGTSLEEEEKETENSSTRRLNRRTRTDL
ncbi:hypothetical protein EV426DRAFT_720362 [Tirmania nivea]|nr:hypothetical protein EV426DRAFT_720362 [Tirmania nivea]